MTLNLDLIPTHKLMTKYDKCCNSLMRQSLTEEDTPLKTHLHSLGQTTRTCIGLHYY